MPAVLRDGLSRKDSLLKLRVDAHPTSNTHTAAGSQTNPEPENHKKRKPSPGLAARLKALGFGKESSKATNLLTTQEQVGRLPEDRYDRLIHRSKSTNTLNVQAAERRGRGLSNISGAGSDISGDIRAFEVRARRSPSVASCDGKEVAADAAVADMDSFKYRLPEHTNGNGTKAMADTKTAHFERIAPPPGSDTPPPALSTDTPPGGTTPSGFDPSSYFNPFGLQRAGSIYTISRVSFASQLAQLTSLQLPDAESLSTKIAAIPTAKAASRALMGAAEQIRSWISKASEVVSGLDGEDDVEWAAAGGREGLEEVDNAISRFEQLITVYVSAIESLQKRPDVAAVQSDELKLVVVQVETILAEWEKIKKNLRGVKNSVEIAMEWEELWNVVLGDIGNEMDVLSRLVFEMEEKRHRSLMAEAGNDGVDISELETIVEETPPSKTRSQANNRFSMLPPFPLSPNSPNTPAMTQDDSSLLALFARMQPLRASLDFLPMRLSTFHSRAEETFPTACEELETRRAGLEKSWKNLERDAESLRRELGEDRWVLVFRGAGRQAQKMYESVERSLSKLRECVDQGLHLNNPSTMGKKIESYEAKKTHYGPAIERVLSIIEKGVKDRLTVNGEILRLHSDMQHKWEKLKEQLHELDIILEDIQADKRNQQLRDSISSIVSNDRSTVRSSNDTPGSSPASSVVMSGLSGPLDSATPANGKTKSATKSGIPQSRRISSLPTSRSSLTTRLSSSETPSPINRQGAATPIGNRFSRPGATSSLDNRPRWNSSVNTHGTPIGHNFKPMTLTTPSPHAKFPPSTHSNNSNRLSSSESKIPLRSPLSRENTASPAPQSTPSRTSFSRLGIRTSSPGPNTPASLSTSTSALRPRQPIAQKSMSALGRRVSLQPQSSDPTGSSPVTKTPVTPRPASSMAFAKRSSLLPQPKSEPRGRKDSSVTGRESPQAIAGAAMAMRRNSSHTSTDSKGKEKKPWR